MASERLLLTKLNDWDDNLNPTAPLSEKEKNAIAALHTFCEEKYSVGGLNSESTIKEENTEIIETSQQFLEWYSKLEDEMLDEVDINFKTYITELEGYHSQCSMLLDEAVTALNNLNSLGNKYEFVSNKTNSLHEACEHLLSEQGKLVNAVESISEKLTYFNELNALSQRLAAPTLSVLHESFVPILSRVDECVAYLEKNSHYKETGTYLARFQQLLTQALGMIRSYVINTLQNTTHQVLPKREGLSSPNENAFTLYYGKFRTHSPRIRALMEQIEERVENNVTYQQLLEDCHQCFFSQRELLLGPSVSVAITDLANTHQRDHCSLLRSGCVFLVHLCEDEHQLYQQFFSRPTDQLDKFLLSLCQRLYDVLRPIIIHVVHLETLAELCTILKVEMIEEHVNNNQQQLKAFQQIAHQMLEDVQERLVYRTNIYIQTDILNYSPAPGDLAYPEKLQMMESIAESLAQGTLSRSSSRSSLISSTSSFPRSEPATIKISSSEQVVETSSCTVQSDQASQISQGRQRNSSNSCSPADLHGMWYPTVRRTLVCLSKLFRCLDKSIFQGLSQEVLGACIVSLAAANQSISKNKTPLDGLLFHIKHLLILREQIAPFQIDFAIKEMSLDFSRMKAAAYSLFQKKSKLFAISSNNSLLEFILEGTPQVTEHLIDSKKAVDNQLKTVCEEFINYAASFLLGPLQPFLQKVNVILKVQAEEPGRKVSLRNQPFASPEEISQTVSGSYRNLKSSLTSLQQSMGLYLSNKDTEYILYRPVKNRVQSAYENLIQIIKTNYSEEEQMAIGHPSLEQINILLSSTFTK